MARARRPVKPTRKAKPAARKAKAPARKARKAKAPARKARKAKPPARKAKPPARKAKPPARKAKPAKAPKPAAAPASRAASPEALEEAAEAMLDFLMTYVEKRKGFRRDGVEVDDQDEAAFTIANATAWNGEPKITLMFRCASALETTSEPVQRWMRECVDAVRAARPAAAMVAELVPTCVQANGPGLEI